MATGELDFRDVYIGYQGHPNFQAGEMIVDDAVRVIVQKIEMILFTNKGELYGDPNFGCDLEKLLYQTNISAFAVKNIIVDQIKAYIPEIVNINYGLTVTFQQDPINYQDVMIIGFTLLDQDIFVVIGGNYQS